MIRKVAWFVFFAVLAVSCLDEPDCFNLNNNFVGISFRKLSDNVQDTIIFVSVSAEGADSIFIDQPTQVNGTLKLPIDYLRDTTTISFQRVGQGGTVATNTLVLGYSAKAQFVSQDCGERFVVSDLHVVSSDFDSTRLVSAAPSKSVSSNSGNIIIYRCPVTNYVKFSFRQLYTDTVKLGKAMSVKINGITAAYSPSELFYEDATTSSVRLPLDPSGNSTQFDFSIDGAGDSTITVTYNKVEETRYVICGPQEFYTNLTVQSSEFPITRVVKDSLQDPPITNIAFLKCPSTNLVKMVFKASTAANAANQSVTINKITADYTPEIFYQDTTVNSITLPLNLEADQTNFSIEFNNSGTPQIKELDLKYVRNSPYHEDCPDQLINSLEVLQPTGFTTTPVVNDNTVKFPTVNNIAIVND